MRRFFVERISDPCDLSSRESRHAVRVLRLTTGDRVVVFDPREAWTGEIASVQGCVRIRLLERAPRIERSAVTIAAAVPKGSRLDWMVEKLAELGTSEFIPVRFARSVAGVSASRRLRLEKIAVSAAKQSGAPLMRIAEERPVKEIPLEAWLADPDAEGILEAGVRTVLVGPEGGLTPEEENLFTRRFRLGPTVLRVETAALAAATRLLA